MKKKEKRKRVVWVILAVFLAAFVMMWIDVERVKSVKRPLFVIQTGTYRDSGSRRLSGLGYTVMHTKKTERHEMGSEEYFDETVEGYALEHWIFSMRVRMAEVESGPIYKR